ncbi:hypothetical protein J0871_16945 [Salegentibacter sp. BDJ18]|uniref:hypothetical protein n=1 Tax=Salegentibacter sp. BDJ18 TaxID=2816376 RepID=UPI001AAFABAE|nr:hypothetical protein [Salegentibacter sp. BDJ18]MBO2546106.1 hypothetical protein [Salegentibacter sp. BDJ18]
MTPEGLNFINYLQEIPGKVRIVEYDKVFTNNVCISRVELRETALNEAEIEMARYHIKNGCPEIVITHNEGDDVPRGLPYEHLYYSVPPDAVELGIDKYYKKNNENSFQGVYVGLTEPRLREKLREEEAKENYEMCAEILKYAESKGFDLNKN